MWQDFPPTSVGISPQWILTQRKIWKPVPSRSCNPSHILGGPAMKGQGSTWMIFSTISGQSSLRRWPKLPKQEQRSVFRPFTAFHFTQNITLYQFSGVGSLQLSLDFGRCKADGFLRTLSIPAFYFLFFVNVIWVVRHVVDNNGKQMSGRPKDPSIEPKLSARLSTAGQCVNTARRGTSIKQVPLLVSAYD